MLRALDLFCGAGGAAMGLHRAGFEVVGVDIKPQPRYPFHFVQADALTFPLDGFDFIWASPPCQGYSQAMRHLSYEQPKLVEDTRARMNGIPWCIENVQGAPLRNPIMLCGQQFGLPLYRHRLFECSFPIEAPPHEPHTQRASRAGHYEEGTIVSVAGHCAPIARCRAAMGIDWMNREELAEAIPPAYSEYIGRQFLKTLGYAEQPDVMLASSASPNLIEETV